eukprot:g12254.t1
MAEPSTSDVAKPGQEKVGAGAGGSTKQVGCDVDPLAHLSEAEQFEKLKLPNPAEYRQQLHESVDDFIRSSEAIKKAAATSNDVADAHAGAASASVANSNMMGAGAPEVRAMMQELEAEEEKMEKMQHDLRDLLLDGGRFHDFCQQGFEQEGNKLEQPKNLQNALNVITKELGMDEVTAEEAEDLWMEDLNLFEFYAAAKKFFEAIHRTMNEENDNLLLAGLGGGGA